MTRSYYQMKSASASAPFANALFPCAHSARNIVMILDAIILASIIVCALAVRLSVLVLALLVLILLVLEQVNKPTARMSA